MNKRPKIYESYSLSTTLRNPRNPFKGRSVRKTNSIDKHSPKRNKPFKGRWRGVLSRKKWLLKSKLIEVGLIRRYRLLTKHRVGSHITKSNFRNSIKRRRRLRRVFFRRIRRSRWKIWLTKKNYRKLRQKTVQIFEKRKTTLRLKRNILLAIRKIRISSRKTRQLKQPSTSLTAAVLKYFDKYNLNSAEFRETSGAHSYRVYRRKAKIRMNKAFFNRLKNRPAYRQFVQNRRTNNDLQYRSAKLTSTIFNKGLDQMRAHTDVKNVRSVGGRLTKASSHVRKIYKTSLIGQPIVQALGLKTRIDLSRAGSLSTFFKRATWRNAILSTRLRGLSIKSLKYLLQTNVKNKTQLLNFASNARSFYRSLPVKKVYKKWNQTSVPLLLDADICRSWSYGWVDNEQRDEIDYELDYLKTFFWGHNSLNSLKQFTNISTADTLPLNELTHFFNSLYILNFLNLTTIHRLPYKTYLTTTISKITALSGTLASDTTRSRDVPLYNHELKSIEKSFVGSYNWNISLNNPSTSQKTTYTPKNTFNNMQLAATKYYNILASTNPCELNLNFDKTLLLLTKTVNNNFTPQLNYLGLLKNQLSVNRSASLAAYSIKRNKSGDKSVKKPTVFTYLTSSYNYLIEHNLSTIRNRNYFYWNTSVTSTSLHVSNGVMQAPALLNWNDDHWENALYIQPKRLHLSELPSASLESKLATILSSVHASGGRLAKFENKFIMRLDKLNLVKSQKQPVTTMLSNQTTRLGQYLARNSLLTKQLRKYISKTLVTRVKNTLHRKKTLKFAPRLRLRLKIKANKRSLYRRVSVIRQFLRTIFFQRRIKKKFMRFVVSPNFDKLISKATTKTRRRIRRVRQKVQLAHSTISKLKYHIHLLRQKTTKTTKKAKKAGKREIKIDVKKLKVVKSEHRQLKQKATNLTRKLSNWQRKFVERKPFIKRNAGFLTLTRWFNNSMYVAHYFRGRVLKKRLRVMHKLKWRIVKRRRVVQKKRRKLKKWLFTRTLNESIGSRNGGLLEHIAWMTEYSIRNQIVYSSKIAITSGYRYLSDMSRGGASFENVSNATRYTDANTATPLLLSNLFFLNTALSKKFLFKYLLVRFKHHTNSSSYDFTINSFKTTLWNFNLFYFTNRFEILKQSNILPTPSFSYNIRRRLLKLFIFRRFPPSISVWYFNMLVRFMEFCTGRKIYLKINPHVENNLTLLDHIQCKMWEWRVASFQRVLGPKIFINESLRIILLALKYKDPTFLINWIKAMLYRMSFWKYRTLFRYLKFVIRDLFEPNFEKFGLRGFKLKLKGKISVAGNARTRVLRMKIGRTSHSKKNNKVTHSFTLINSFTGVMGFNIWIFF